MHLVKICVGATGIESLAEWQAGLIARGAPFPFHVTRMFPRREAELLDGGSLYWTMANRFSVRQRIIGLVRETGQDGVARCRIEFDPELVPVAPHPRRPFQGWRYLECDDAPADLETNASDPDGAALLTRLADLGLL